MKAIGSFLSLPVSDPNCLVDIDVPTPTPGPNQLLVQVMATSVNPVDTKIRKSLGSNPLPQPRILGWDAAGIVTATGANVTQFQVGDEVFYSGDFSRSGCNSEFHAIDQAVVALKPPSWSFSEAAAIPLVALTAWELLFERMGVNPASDRGKSILIINGAGGVGSALIPIAKMAGLKVVATASRPHTTQWCQALGADFVINHRIPLDPQLKFLGFREFPFIANLYNTEAYWNATAELIAPFGTLGLIVEPSEKLHIGDPLKAKCVRIAWEFMAARTKLQSPDRAIQGQYLSQIAAACENGSFPKIHTRIFNGIHAANLREAHAAMEAGSAHGKWVLSATNPSL